MHPALGFVAAVGAADVGGLAGARHRGEGTVEHADDLAEIDLGRIPGQEIPAALALPALEHAVVLEAEEDELEELGRDLLFPGQVRDAHRLRALGVGEGEQGFDGVLGLLGEHERRI